MKTIAVIELPYDGEPRVNLEFPCALDAFQEYVEGLIEVVNLPKCLIEELEREFNVKLGPRACLVVNDEGLLLDLPHNFIASLMSLSVGGGPIVGHALVCDVP